jgi:CheY-like chemotaxis protein
MSSPKRPIVLVVEDEPLIRMATAALLEDAGFAVVEAANAEEALGALKTHPDTAVLFTDINMPGSMDGLALAARVHETSPRVHILLTSGRVPPAKEAIPEEGRFIGKPYSIDKVAGLMTAMLAHG